MNDRQQAQPQAGSHVSPHPGKTGQAQRKPSGPGCAPPRLQNWAPGLPPTPSPYVHFDLRNHHVPPRPSNGVAGFSIHPRSHFNGIASQRDITVEETGCYSLHEVVKGQFEVHPDRSLLRQLVVPYEMDSPTTVCFDLNEGFDPDTFKEHSEVGGMWHFHAWLEQQCQNEKLAQLSSTIQIVTSKDILTRLCNIPYNQDCQQDAVGWIFGAARVGKKVIVGKLKRPGIVDTCLVPDASVESEYTLTGYRGRRFESFMTQYSTGDGAKQPEGCSRFRSVAHFRLKDISILLQAGIDGEDPFSKGSNETAYTDVTIMPAQVATKTNALYRTRFFRWYLNSRFINIKTLHVGIHEDGIVQEIHHYLVDDIPQLVKEKGDELGWELWSPDVCFGFLHEILRYILGSVKEDHTSHDPKEYPQVSTIFARCFYAQRSTENKNLYPSAVFEFSCPSECIRKCTCPKRCGVFSCTRIPATDALGRGHTYLPSYQDPKRYNGPSSILAETRAA